MKTRVIRLFITSAAGLLISCNTANNSGMEQAINEIKDNQKIILKKMESMDKSISNLALASKNKPADNKKQQPPQADTNKVYNVEIGDSFSMGPKDAKVTIIKWTDFQ